MFQPLNAFRRRGRASGLTLIELVIVVAIVGTLVALTAPSFKRMIDIQRLRGINAALITDLQFARAEAASRNQRVWVRFTNTGTALTCYVILTGDATQCSCQSVVNDVCPPIPGVGPGSPAIRTVRVEQSLGVTVTVPASQTQYIGFDPATGRLWNIPVDIPEPAIAPFRVNVQNTAIGGFQNEVELTGRPTVCSPGGLMSGVPSCS